MALKDFPEICFKEKSQLSWLASKRHLRAFSLRKLTERWRVTLNHSLILNGQHSVSKLVGGCTAAVKRAASHYSQARPCSLASLHVFKKQTPHHPSPHTQSLVVNNIQLSHGHSLCQTLKGREGVRVSHCGNPATVTCRNRHCSQGWRRVQSQEVLRSSPQLHVLTVELDVGKVTH